MSVTKVPISNNNLRYGITIICVSIAFSLMQEDIGNTSLIKACQSEHSGADSVQFHHCDSENVDPEPHELPSIEAEDLITVEVCNVCLSVSPSIKDLIDVSCFKPGDIDHAKAPRVPVHWNHNSRQIERVRSLMDISADAYFKLPTRARVDIRPMPHVNVPQHLKRFVMCDRGWRCGGDQCTFAHSIEEREAWNEELLEQHAIATERIGGKLICCNIMLLHLGEGPGVKDHTM